MNFLRVVGAIFLAALSAVGAVAADPEGIPLWPAGAPGANADGGEMHVRLENGERIISNVHRPLLFPYIPAEDAATGCGVVICPGGGHRELWSDHEGHNLARWLRDRGVAAFVLYYRLAKEEESPYTVDKDALADAQRALRLVRSRAGEWHVDPHRLGILGFSAGGEIAALAAMQHDAAQAASTQTTAVQPDAGDPIDRQNARPNFQALIYPGSSQRFTADKDSPPVLLIAGYGDRPDISRGLAEVYLKYKDAGVPAELHIYATAGHGFGVRTSNVGALAAWPERLEGWLQDINMVKRK